MNDTIPHSHEKYTTIKYFVKSFFGQEQKPDLTTEDTEKIFLTLMDTDFYMIFTVSIIINLCLSVSNLSVISVPSVVSMVL